MMDVTFGQGWKPVGETGVRHEGAHLAWVTPEFLAESHATVAEFGVEMVSMQLYYKKRLAGPTQR